MQKRRYPFDSKASSTERREENLNFPVELTGEDMQAILIARQVNEFIQTGNA